MDKPTLKARYLASIIGKIMSMSLAIGPVRRLMTRSMYALFNTRKHWSQSLALTLEAKEELQFWIKYIDHINRKEIWLSPSAVSIVCQCHRIWWLQHGCHVAHGSWSKEKMTQSSTWKELREVRVVLESLLPKLKNERVHWFSDNQNVVRILDIGSKKPDLQKEALALFTTASQNLISI